jgi:hypothetical protein
VLNEDRLILAAATEVEIWIFLTFVGYNFSAPSMAFLKDGIIYLKIGVNLYLLGYSVFTLAYARPPCRPKT